MKKPQLRFPEFQEDWEHHNLGEIASFSKGKGISKADIVEDGATECIRYGELYTTYGETIDEVKSRTNINVNDLVLSEANDVIIPASGETQIDIATASCVLRDGIALGGDLNIIKTKNNGVFLSYYLNNRKKLEIASLAQGISVVHLYANQLSLLELNLPTKEEQDKIALFVRSTDEKIQALKKKHSLLDQYKKGVMQKLFSQELRLKDDNGNDFPEWEEKKFGDTLEIVIDNRGKTPPVEKSGIPLLEVNSIGSKDINYKAVSKFVNQDTFDNWFRKYLKVEDVLFSTVGNTALCSYYDGKFEAVIAQNIVGFRFKDELGLFMYYLLTEENNYNKIKSIEMGAVQPSIKVSQLTELFFKIPTKAEQLKISNFLANIDKKIQIVEVESEKLEFWKNGLMQKMFC